MRARVTVNMTGRDWTAEARIRIGYDQHGWRPRRRRDSANPNHQLRALAVGPLEAVVEIWWDRPVVWGDA